MPASPLRVGLLGCGVVGGGVVKILQHNDKIIAERVGRPISITHIATRHPQKGMALEASRAGVSVSEDAMGLVTHPEVDVVVEVMGGIEPAYQLLMAAFKAGKPVVTANKALLALYGNEIFAAARAQKVALAFEAAVAGGIPIIKALREGLVANRIEWIAGIINGTTNFILSTMRRGVSFQNALAEAQRLGYAEADPTMDIDGVDAAHKIAILAALAFDVPMPFEHVQVRGIRQLDVQDVRYVEEMGYRVKLLGMAKRHAQGLELRVEPVLISNTQLIADVEGAMNAVLVCGDASGPTLYYGKGAGGKPTASAVIADLVDIARHPQGMPAPLQQQTQTTFFIPAREVVSAKYLRLRVADRPGVLAEIARILADGQISIEAMNQRAPMGGESQVDMVMLTNHAKEENMQEALKRIAKLEVVAGPVVCLRVEELGGSLGT